MMNELGAVLGLLLLMVLMVAVPFYLLSIIARVMVALSARLSKHAEPVEDDWGAEQRPKDASLWPMILHVSFMMVAILLAVPITLEWAAMSFWAGLVLLVEPGLRNLLLMGGAIVASGFVMAVFWRSVFLTAQRCRVRFGRSEAMALGLVVLALAIGLAVDFRPEHWQAHRHRVLLPGISILSLVFLQFRMWRSSKR